MNRSTKEEAVARFYDHVKFGLSTPDPAQQRFLGEHLLGQIGLTPESLRGRRVLEVGTGRGNWTSVLAAEAEEYQGVDLSEETVAFIRQRHTPNIQVGNAKAIPFENERFDRVFAIGVLPAVEGDRKAFSELVRVLEPGGHLHLMGYGRVFPRNLFRDAVFGLTQRWSEEKKAKLCYHFTRLAGWPIPDAWLFNGDQLYAQLDWYYAPIQNRHTRAQLDRWRREEGLQWIRYAPYPHRRPMRLHALATLIPGLASALGPDYFAILRKPERVGSRELNEAIGR